MDVSGKCCISQCKCHGEEDWDHVNDPVLDKVRKGFSEVGEQVKASFSENSPAEIEYIVIISDIAEFSFDVHQNKKNLGVPVRGYVATSRRVTRKEWEVSILLCSTELEHLSRLGEPASEEGESKSVCLGTCTKGIHQSSK
jgi:hypothetical protein